MIRTAYLSTLLIFAGLLFTTDSALAQEPNECNQALKPAIFDDFNYNSEGSLISSNPWRTSLSDPALTDNITAWNRYNWGNVGLDLGTISVSNGIVKLKVDANTTLNGTHLPAIMSRFIAQEGTYHARVRFSPLPSSGYSGNRKLQSAFWLDSPDHYFLHYANDSKQYWSEADHEWNNYFDPDKYRHHVTNHSSDGGKETKILNCHVLVQPANPAFMNSSECDESVIPNRWWNVKMVVENDQVSYSMYSPSNQGTNTWWAGGSSFDQDMIISQNEPNRPMSTRFSIENRSGISNPISGPDDITVEIDWFYFSPCFLDEVAITNKTTGSGGQIGQLRTQNIDRLYDVPIGYAEIIPMTTVPGNDPNVEINGPTTLSSGASGTWTLDIPPLGTRYDLTYEYCELGQGEAFCNANWVEIIPAIIEDDLSFTHTMPSNACGIELRATLTNNFWSAQTGVLGDTDVANFHIANTSETTCPLIPLVTGWNLISFDVDFGNLDAPAEVFEPLIDAGVLESVISNLPTGGESYAPPPSPPFLNNLSDISPGLGYWVKVSKNVTLPYIGSALGPSFSIELSEGWNLKGYWLSQEQSPSDAFASLISVNQLESVTSPTESESYAPPPSPPFLNTLTEIKRHLGYWVKVNTNIPSFSFPTPPAASKQMLAGAELHASGIHVSPEFMIVEGRVTMPRRKEFIGEKIQIVTESGLLVGETTIMEKGLLLPAGVFGDDPTTAEIDGAQSGEKLYFILSDGRMATALQGSDPLAFKTEPYIPKVRPLHLGFSQHGRAKSEDELSSEVPDVFKLSSAYPNPFNPETMIRYGLPEASSVYLAVYDLLGREVRQLVSSHQKAGYHQVRWDGRAEDGTALPSGVYLYRLQTDEFEQTRQVVMLK